MAKIKVTGVIYTENLEPELVDLNDAMGLSEAGYLAMIGNIGLDDLDFVLDLDGEE